MTHSNEHPDASKQNNEYYENGFDIQPTPEKKVPETTLSERLFIPLVVGFSLIFSAGGIILMFYECFEGGIPLTTTGILILIILWIRINQTTMYFEKMQQRINSAASNVDVYIQQRVLSMKSLAKFAGAGMQNELDIMLSVAQSRSHGDTDLLRANLDGVLNKFCATVEAYPEYHSHVHVQRLMEADAGYVRDISAAKVIYNDLVLEYNTALYSWPLKKLVAEKKCYSTRIPLIISASTREYNEESDFDLYPVTVKK